MTVIEAPVRMGRRAQAVALLEELPRSLVGVDVTVTFPDEAYHTTSFLDEVVRSILVDRKADRLKLANANERVVELACQSAEDLSVLGRLVIA